MTSIVVADGYALNPGDLSWDEIRSLGSLTVYDRTTPEELPQRAGEAELLLTNKTVVDAASLDSLKRLRYIGVLATGHNVVDVGSALERGIVVTNVPAYSTPSVSQLIFAHLLELTSHVQLHSDGVHAGEWSRSPDFSYRVTPLIELADKTMGIVGSGRIGGSVARIAEAMGMRVIVNSRTRPREAHHSVQWTSLEELLRRSDVVCLTCPLTAETKGMINRSSIALMKPTAFLINASRGPLVVEQELADALNEGRIAGAGLDVLSTEPPASDNPLLGVRNCTITPHIGWATREARERLLAVAAANIRAFLAGAPQNVVT